MGEVWLIFTFLFSLLRACWEVYPNWMQFLSIRFWFCCLALSFLGECLRWFFLYKCWQCTLFYVGKVQNSQPWMVWMQDLRSYPDLVIDGKLPLKPWGHEPSTSWLFGCYQMVLEFRLNCFFLIHITWFKFSKGF